jgi:hypothetical protein
MATQETKKRSKKTSWFKRGDRVVWDVTGTGVPGWHGTVKEVFRRVGSKLYTLVWVNWDKTPGDRELVNVEWLQPEPALDTLARILPYEAGQKVKLVKQIKIDCNGKDYIAPAGTVGIVLAGKRRKRRQPAQAVHFDFLPEGRCLLLFHAEIAPAE